MVRCWLEQKRFNAVFCKHTDGEGDLRHRMAFVIMRPALEDDYFGLTQVADQGLAGMAWNTRREETGQFCVGNGRRNGGLFGGVVKAAAQHEGELGAQ